MKAVAYVSGEKLALALKKVFIKLEIEDYRIFTQEYVDNSPIVDIDLHKVDILILHPMMFRKNHLDAILPKLKAGNDAKVILLVGTFSSHIRNRLQDIEVKKRNIIIQETINMTSTNLKHYLELSIAKLNEAFISKYIHLIGTSSKNNIIVRSIIFEPEHYQSGITILSYFGKFLKNKYPDKNVKVTIEQGETVVRMIIEPPTGEKELVERSLYEYGLVMAGELAPEEAVSDKMAVFELKSQMNLIQYQLQQSIEMKELYRNLADDRQRAVVSLQDQVHTLTSAVVKSLVNRPELDVLREALELAKNNHSLQEDINYLILKLNQNDPDNDEERIKATIMRINKQNPSVITHLLEFAENAAAGVTGNYIFSYLQKMF